MVWIMYIETRTPPLMRKVFIYIYRLFNTRAGRQCGGWSSRRGGRWDGARREDLVRIQY